MVCFRKCYRSSCSDIGFISCVFIDVVSRLSIYYIDVGTYEAIKWQFLGYITIHETMLQAIMGIHGWAEYCTVSRSCYNMHGCFDGKRVRGESSYDLDRIFRCNSNL